MEESNSLVSVLPAAISSCAAALCLLISLVLVALGACRPGEFPVSASSGAMLLVAAISIFSTNAAVAFAAVFIIAVTFTDGKFLHMLAAIIGNCTAYFGHLERMSWEDVRRKRMSEVDEALRSSESVSTADGGAPGKSESLTEESQSGKVPEEEISGHVRNMRHSEVARHFEEIEEMAIDWFDRVYNDKAQRWVRATSMRGTAEFDGYSKKLRAYIEVKASVGQHYRAQAKSAFRRCAEIRPILESDEDLLLIFVVPNESIRKKATEVFDNAKMTEPGVRISVIVLTFDDIGFRKGFGQEGV